MRDRVRDEYYLLLKEWTDALLACVLNDPIHPSLDGALICPACTAVHGRCHEAVYPLLAMADLSGENKYLDAARKLFKWSSYMLCDDGSLYNDSQSAWNGTTVFSAIALLKALRYHSRLLTAEERAAWEERLNRMVLWLRDGITPEKRFNVNYIAANAAALALAGRRCGEEEWLARAKALEDFALRHVTGEGLVYGEGSPEKHATPRGGCAVDVGYNVEETLPSLYECAEALGDGEALSAIRESARAHLDLMLPDGAWDNSFGTRNFKWTYWGSRTADGCQALFNALGKTEPVFAEAAYRNLKLYERCTSGLLYGGPHYRRHGELPCVHHAFCHAKVLAQALDEGVAEFGRTCLPSDSPVPVRYYPGTGTYRLSSGDWRMTVCAGDFAYMKGGHASGGAVTLLWHRSYGPVLAAGNTDHSLREPMNQQLTRQKGKQGSLCPGLVKGSGGAALAQAYDFSASVAAEILPGSTAVHVSGTLCGADHRASSDGDAYSLVYDLSGRGLRVTGAAAAGAVFVLPVVCPADQTPAVSGRGAAFEGGLRVASAAPVGWGGSVFGLAPGFEAARLLLYPDGEGRFDFRVSFEGRTL